MQRIEKTLRRKKKLRTQKKRKKMILRIKMTPTTRIKTKINTRKHLIN